MSDVRRKFCMNDDAIRRLLGRRIRSRRRGLCLTQAKLGSRCGVSFQQIQKYETGVATLSVSRLLTLANALETSAECILDGLQSLAEPGARRAQGLRASSPWLS